MATGPATARSLPFPALIFVLSLFTSRYLVSGDEHSLAVSQLTSLQLSPALPMENSPGSRPGAKVLCERVQIRGLPRLKNLNKYANSVIVNISHVTTGGRLPNVEVCFHRNQSRGIGMCPQSQWTRITKGSLIRSMSPFDHKFLDFRILGSSKQTLQVSLHEEFYLYRIVFLVLGILLMAVASSLSKSLVFYYSGAMVVGIFLVILMVLFQGMKLLPTGRKNSLAIFIYSSLVGLGSFLLRYVPTVLCMILTEIGIGEDMYNPLAIFLLLFLVIAGAWLGFWVVRKLVLTDDGSIDIGVSHFIAWAIRIVASTMILQEYLDILLAAEALVCGIFGLINIEKNFHLKFIRLIYKKSSRMIGNICEILLDLFTPTYKESYPRPPSNGTIPRFNQQSPKPLSDSDTFYSSYHKTPERRKISKEDLEKLTQQTTKRAMEELVASPDFSRWAVAHADRITLAPKKATPDRQRRWYHWS
nr:Nuclear envelope integral membrane protein [Ipomoea batatas]